MTKQKRGFRDFNRYRPRRERSADPQQQSSDRRAKLKSTVVRLIPVIKFALICVALWFIFLNIQPYIKIVELMLESATERGLWDFVMRLPILGALLLWIASIRTTILATILWMVVQFFELLPSILESNRSQIRLLIDGLQRAARLTPSNKDDELVARLKEKYNTFPHRLINRARWVSVVVYVIDFLLCIWTFPPLRGGLDALNLFLLAPSWGDIDLKNALTCLATLFAVEICYHAYNWVANMLTIFSQPKVITPPAPEPEPETKDATPA